MEWKALILNLIYNFLGLILTPVFWYLARGKKKTVPAIENGLLTLSATTLAQRIRQKQLTSEEVIKAYIQRVKEVNPIINAVVQDRFTEALEEAKAVDAFLQETDMEEEEIKTKKPLLGVPLTVKECAGVQGMKMTLGSLHHIDDKAAVDGDPVHKLKKAGAIPLLISNTPEYSLSWDTSNYVTGKTNNPYDTTRSSGGSSGGEGALIASGASVIGVGSDLGGSIRIPSAFNGIFGHKPTRKLVSIENHIPMQKSEGANELNTVGPMCRYAEDLNLMLKIMSGDTDNKFGLDDEVDLSKLDVFFMESASRPILEIGVQSEIQRAIRRATAHLRDNCNSKIQKTKFPGLSAGFFIATSGIFNYDYKNPEIDCGVKDPKNFNIFRELLKFILGKSSYTFHLIYMQLTIQMSLFLFRKRKNEFVKLGEDLKTYMMSKLGTTGVLLYPNFPMAAPRHFEFPVAPVGLMYTMVFNVLGFPSTAVPMGLDANGLPIGIQVVAGPNQDRLCLAVAKELSKLGGWVPPS